MCYDTKREPFWSPTGLTERQLAELREEEKKKQIWNENTWQASQRRPIHDGGNLAYGGPK